MPAVLSKQDDQHLHRALKLVEEIEERQGRLAALLEKGAPGTASKEGRRKLPTEFRQRVKAALKTQFFNESTHRREAESKPGRRQARATSQVIERPRKSAPFDPFEAGRKAVMQMQEAEGGAWTGAELDKLLGLTSANLHKRRAEHRIVFWRNARNLFHYPKWQFNEAGALWPGLQEILQTLQSADEWRIMRYFLGSRGQFAGRTPLDLLRAGKVAPVVAHAILHASENTW